jgi:hypothetical protein
MKTRHPMAPGLVFCAMLFAGQNALAQFSQQGPKLVGSGAVGAASQGAVAVSADGNTAIIGGADDHSAIGGAAWVFTRTGETWSQQGSKLVGTGATTGGDFGRSVGISADGDTAVIGNWADNSNNGATWIFTRSGGAWSQQGGKLIGTGAVGKAHQGWSVGISADGNTIAVGANVDNAGAGAVWIFTRSGETWSQQGGKLVGTGAAGNAQQGASVALSGDGNTLVVGGPLDQSQAGAAWVFTRSGFVWSQQGGKLVGTGAAGSAGQGHAVAISGNGDTVVSGGLDDDAGAGAVWAFTRAGSAWSQQGGKLVGTGAAGAAGQGSAVGLAADGDTAVVGGDQDHSGAGAAWVFTRGGNTWSQQGDKLVGTGAAGVAHQGAGVAVSSDGRTALVAGPGDASNLGATWVFTRARCVPLQERDCVIPVVPGAPIRVNPPRPE